MAAAGRLSAARASRDLLALAGDHSCVGQRTRQAVELGDDERIAGAACCEGLVQAGALPLVPVRPWSTELGERIENEPDEEKKGRLVRLRDGFLDVGRTSPRGC